MEGIEAVTVQPNQQDRWGWKLDPSEYTQREVLTICYPLTLQGEILMKCSRKFGRSKFQVSHFSWRLIRDRLPTKMNLKRRNVDSNDFSCLFFRSSDEDASHSFFNCDKILPLWWESLSWLNVAGASSESPREYFLQYFHGYLKDIRSQRWQMWWISLTWCIWFHRNRIVFSNKTFNGQKMMDDAIFFYWVWLKNLEKRFNISFQYWASNIRIGFCNHGGISI